MGEDEAKAAEQVGEDSAGRAPGDTGARERLDEGDRERGSPRFDEDGLPLDRPPTLDDVRGNAGSGRSIAIGCTAMVAAAILLFWLVRAGLLG